MGDATDRRARAIQRVQARLASPHLLVTFLLVLAASVGFLFSRYLHDACGVRRMGVRYPVAIGFAYLLFILLLGTWVVGRGWNRRRAYYRQRRGAAQPVDDGWWWYWNWGSGPHTSGPSSVSSGSGGVSSGFKLDGDGDGMALVVVVVLVVVAVGVALGACIYVIATAPTLLAEVLVDGTFLATMSRRMVSPAQPTWLASAVGRTWIPAGVMAIVFSVVGFGLEAWAPGATTMAEALQKVLK
jgi:hypothetical protein